MKKGLLIALAVILLLVVVFWGGYVWVQRRITRAMNVQLQKAVRPYVTNPQNLTLTNKPVQIGRDTMRMPEVEITGTDLQLPHELQAQSTHVVIRDVEVNIRGKKKQVTHVGQGAFDITLSADELTKLLHKQQTLEISGLQVQPETLSLTLSRQDGITLAGEGTTPESRERQPFSLRGTLAPDASGEMLFHITESTAGGQRQEDEVGKAYPLPAGSLLPAALTNGRIQDVSIGDGTITFKGSFDGAALLQNH